MIKGIIYNETWGGRKTAADQVVGVVNTIEYILRKQNWLDNAGTPLIKTSGVGSFVDSSLAELNTFSIARELLEYSETWSDALIKSLCSEFFLWQYQDGAGNECITNLIADKTPLATILFADCKNRGSIELPDCKDIYCEPVINYGYDYATGAHTKSLKVLNVAKQDTWTADCTPGFVTGEGEIFWDMCKHLYDKHKVINPMPTSISDSKWVVDYSTAKWRMDRLTGATNNSLSLADKCRIKVSVWYSVAGSTSWINGQRVILKLPQETDNKEIECVIESISKKRGSRSVDITLIMLDEIAEEIIEFLYQDSDEGATSWQDSDDGTAKYQNSDL